MTTPREILRLEHVLRRTGLPISTLYARMKDGAFPRPVKLGARAVGWASDEVDGWVQQRIAERDGEAA